MKMTKAPPIPMRHLSLATLMGGAAVDMVDEKFSRVAENIYDPNTEATAKRVITLKIEVTPHASREMAEVAVAVDMKIAGDKAQKGSLFVSRTVQGQTFLTEKNAKQLDLEDEVAKKTAADVPRSALATSSLDTEADEEN
jgi:hypothetical protein